MDYKNPKLEGKLAFVRGLGKSSCQIDRRTHANHYCLWQQGWDEQSKMVKQSSSELGAINIILEESNSTPDVYFVEIENDKGESISMGERSKRDDALTSLRIRAEDIINHLAINSRSYMMEDSYITNCFIKRNGGDLNIITGHLQDDGSLVNVRVRLDGYSIIPTIEYQKLKAISEKAVTETLG